MKMNKHSVSRREQIRRGKLWKLAIEKGMTEREVICLQDGYNSKELAELWNVGTARVNQIKRKAMRKMHHPMRVRLVLDLEINQIVKLSEDRLEYAKNCPPTEVDSINLEKE